MRSFFGGVFFFLKRFIKMPIATPVIIPSTGGNQLSMPSPPVISLRLLVRQIAGWILL